MPAPVRKSPAKEADSRQSEIVKAAYMQIAEVGLEGLRTRDVAARVGINIATLHYYFPSKEDLVLAVVHNVNETFETMRAPLVEGSSLVEQMLSTASLRKKLAPELHAVLNELNMRGARDEAVAAAMGKMQSDWRSWLEQELRKEIASGVIRKDVDPRLTAAMLSSLVIGANMQLLMSPTAFDVEDLMRHLESLLRTEKKKPAAKKR